MAPSPNLQADPANSWPHSWQAASLFARGEFVFYLLPTTLDLLDEVQRRLTAAHPEAVVRRIEGARSRTTRDFFRNIAVALEFPDERVSWNILNERLYDLTWLPASAYLLLVDNADQFLIDAPKNDLTILSQILDAPVEVHFTPGSEVVPRNLLLQCTTDALPDLTARLNAAEVRFLTLQPLSEWS